MTALILLIRNNRWAQIGGIALLAFIAFLAFKVWLGDVKEDAGKKAVTTERAGQLEQTINRMETADETRREVRDDRSRARYDECLQSARNPANCQRFLPQ
jgi:membrane protein implicated in regulation of membrane protease activity